MWDTTWNFLIDPKYSGVIQAFAGAASASFAFVLIWTTICQIRIYHKMRIDSILRDRAAIFPKELRFESGHKIGQSAKTQATFWNVMPVWENTGGTPTAEMVNYISLIWINGDIIPPEFDFPNVTNTGTIQLDRLYLGPRQTMFGHTLTLETRRLNETKEGKGFYYLYGWTEYRDVFDRRKLHRTEFCRQLIPKGLPTDPAC